jgi:cephalosporin hydroxylase
MSNDDRSEFAATAEAQVAAQGVDPAVLEATRAWMLATQPHKYSYHFSWLGLPIIQYPPDIVAVQELIWDVKPDLIIETGVARGGSLLLSASVLALIELAEATKAGEKLDPAAPSRRVLGIDIDIRAHNRAAIERHPLASRITMIEGSSVADEIIAEVRAVASEHRRVMVLLDSDHTHEHVLAELHAYGPLVSPGSYCVVFDTIIEDMPSDAYPDRSWGPGNNPSTAVRDYLASASEFSVDHKMDERLLISVARGGYLRRTTHVTR